MRPGSNSALLALMLCLFGVAAAGAGVDSLEIGKIEDLPFGEVLFYFYQDDYFPALTRLMAAEKRDQLDDHGNDAELLRGGMMLSYGLHREAGDIFNRLLDRDVPQSVKDRAWYFLARVWFQRGYYEKADMALSRIVAPLPQPMEDRQMMLRAQVMMARGDFNSASRLLDDWNSDGEFANFARFNLGVALVRQGRVSEATHLLDQIGGLRTTKLEMLGLRDRANLALGFALIQDGQPDRARKALGRVRLSGPFSNKALLGAGWADTISENYQRALVPWGSLEGRDLLDPAVLESMLAIPYALGKLQANRRAADAYLNAVQAYVRETKHLDQAIERMREGTYLRQLLSDDELTDPGWSWRLKTIPDNDDSHFLYLLVASHRFQEGLRNYRDLRFLQYNLQQWQQSLVAFEDMLDTRELAYAQKEPAVVRAIDNVDLEQYERRRLKFHAALAAIESNQDFQGLASQDELSQYRRLRAAGKKLDLLPYTDQTNELREKYRFLLGVLNWRLESQHKERMWRQKKSLNDIDAAMLEARQRSTKVSQARTIMPGKFVAYRRTINDMRPKVKRLIKQSSALADRQREYLQFLAIAELEAQKERLHTYQVQARFALATIYDQATTQELSP